MRRGFDHYNASEIADTLTKHGFFNAKHTVTLNGQQPRTISTQEELEQVIEDEKNLIMSDPDLRSKFDKISKPLDKNTLMRDLRKYLSENPHVLPYLKNPGSFRQDVWIAYFKSVESEYVAFIEEHERVEKEVAIIEEKAKHETNLWELAINKFNNRFTVPFKLVPKNKIEVALEKEKLLKLGFVFDDGSGEMPVERQELMKGLSSGERKAMYILNIIFEFERRKTMQQPSLLVVDDIADSFDYKNKYAIVEYLMEISREPGFFQILLTHNFDFFRTINRKYVPNKQCYMVAKSATGLTISEATGIRDVFTDELKDNFYKSGKAMIACIPFTRNIVQLTSGKNSDYDRLTSLLHMKADTGRITLGDLSTIYNRVFSKNGAFQSGEQSKLVVDVIHAEAQICVNAPEGANFENKIVLSIAIRLAAEEFMIKALNDPAFVSQITSNQTWRLFNEYRNRYPSGYVEALERVNLMTPETIHLNSFMYEPIVDMSDSHLKKLYSEVRALI